MDNKVQKQEAQSQEVPNVLFKHLDAGGIKVLENLELMFSNPADFNDPFEFLPCLTPCNEESCGEERAYQAQKLVRHYGLNSFILSMTDKEHNVRMWDHYSDRHQGLMISLDFGGTLARYRGWVLPVKYTDQKRFGLLGESLE